jgi:hypothetical protein
MMNSKVGTPTIQLRVQAAKSALLDDRAFRAAPPGPAYYHPRAPAAKASFHLNARRAYV